MITIGVRNVCEALPVGLQLLREEGVERDSRNGKVLVMRHPVTTVYERPWERVLIDPQRDANPFFHFYEMLWMIAGRNDVHSVAKFAKQMKAYSDDGHTLNGAYGHRWRRHFLNDQLPWAIETLRKDPESRRVVIQMWDANNDIGRLSMGTKDVPCNTQCYVWVNPDGLLCLTVLCRSNDIIWGAHGANAVHFSFLQQYLACALGRDMGPLYQVSNNYHAYLPVMEKMGELKVHQLYAEDLPSIRPGQVYLEQDQSKPFHNENYVEFDEDVHMLDENVTVGLRTRWLRRVAQPVLRAHQAYRDLRDPQRHVKALDIIDQIKEAPDWRVACAQWISRRYTESQRAKEDGVQHDG